MGDSPAAKGEPGIGVNTPLLALIVYPEIVPEVLSAVKFAA
jgi:hypothetical protein